MTTQNTNAAADYVTCPKCLGAKTFSVWAHIAGGDCFACAGNGTVLRSWIVSPATQGTPSAAAYRAIVLPTFGPACVTRHGAGFQLDYDHGMVVFNLRAGRVVDAIVSDAPRRRGESAALLAEIQAAVKVAA